MQGFFIHVSNGAFPVTAALGMDNRIRVNNLSPAFHKSIYSENQPIVRLNASFENEITADPAVVYFNDFATVAFDTELDALKLMNTDIRVPNLYSLMPQSERTSINAIPYPTDSITRVPLGLKTETDNWVLLKATDIENIPPGMRVYLSDESTGLVQDLRINSECRVHLGKGTLENRFALLFSEKDLVQIAYANETFYAYLANGKPYVYTELAGVKEARLIVSNMLGQVMLQKKLYGKGAHEIDSFLPTGMYVLTLYSQHGVYSIKIFIPNR
jgi:hypothetical protein